jgi:glutaredoxin-related protein
LRAINVVSVASSADLAASIEDDPDWGVMPAAFVNARFP